MMALAPNAATVSSSLPTEEQLEGISLSKLESPITWIGTLLADSPPICTSACITGPQLMPSTNSVHSTRGWLFEAYSCVSAPMTLEESTEEMIRRPYGAGVDLHIGNLLAVGRTARRAHRDRDEWRVRILVRGAVRPCVDGQSPRRCCRSDRCHCFRCRHRRRGCRRSRRRSRREGGGPVRIRRNAAYALFPSLGVNEGRRGIDSWGMSAARRRHRSTAACAPWRVRPARRY